MREVGTHSTSCLNHNSLQGGDRTGLEITVLPAEALNVDTAGQRGKKAAFVTPGLQPLSWENKL